MWPLIFCIAVENICVVGMRNALDLKAKSALDCTGM